ncbi:MAG: hypothetical protein Ta2D_01110 [Rickettsiales bacterium]|nr:MAG: hypothetical protein Ta2D_01110 [Rickettsiales bacterium]
MSYNQNKDMNLVSLEVLAELIKNNNPATSEAGRQLLSLANYLKTSEKVHYSNDKRRDELDKLISSYPSNYITKIDDNYARLLNAFATMAATRKYKENIDKLTKDFNILSKESADKLTRSFNALNPGVHKYRKNKESFDKTNRRVYDFGNNFYTENNIERNSKAQSNTNYASRIYDNQSLDLNKTQPDTRPQNQSRPVAPSNTQNQSRPVAPSNTQQNQNHRSATPDVRSQTNTQNQNQSRANPSNTVPPPIRLPYPILPNQADLRQNQSKSTNTQQNQNLKNTAPATQNQSRPVASNNTQQNPRSNTPEIRNSNNTQNQNQSRPVAPSNTQQNLRNTAPATQNQSRPVAPNNTQNQSRASLSSTTPEVRKPTNTQQNQNLRNTAPAVQTNTQARQNSVDSNTRQSTTQQKPNVAARTQELNAKQQQLQKSQEKLNTIQQKPNVELPAETQKLRNDIKEFFRYMPNKSLTFVADYNRPSKPGERSYDPKGCKITIEKDPDSKKGYIFTFHTKESGEPGLVTQHGSLDGLLNYQFPRISNVEGTFKNTTLTLIHSNLSAPHISKKEVAALETELEAEIKAENAKAKADKLELFRERKNGNTAIDKLKLSYEKFQEEKNKRNAVDNRAR